MQHISQFAVTVRDYDEAVRFYVDVLGFELVEDTDLGEGKRWVRVRPAGSTGAGVLLARAANDRQRASVGNQTGGRVFIFLETDDFDRDHARLRAAGVTFVRPRTEESWGTVAVFQDLYGNLWDLIQRRAGAGPRGVRPTRSPSNALLADQVPLQRTPGRPGPGRTHWIGAVPGWNRPDGRQARLAVQELSAFHRAEARVRAQAGRQRAHRQCVGLAPGP